MAQKKFQDLNLEDAFLFAAALEDEEACKITLQVILNRKVTKVTVHAEHTMLYTSDYRSIRLDVYAQNDDGDYNVEMQGENQGNLPKRSRYHQAKMDVASIPPGADFNDLKPSYVIFICTFDPFGQDLYQYTFENRCVETGLPLGDETTKIFLNTKGKNAENVSPELVNFLQYVENSTEQCVMQLQDEMVGRLHDRVKTLKKSRDWESRYMRFEELLQDAERAGLARGMEKGMAQGIEKGMEQGLEKGLVQGQSRLLQLIDKMVEAGEGELVSRLSKDSALLQEMYEKYQL